MSKPIVIEIPPAIRKAINEMAGRISERHHRDAVSALLSSWKAGGMETTIEGDSFEIQAGWANRKRVEDLTDVWLGYVKVISESTCAIASL